jgi:hypothetical protein
MLAASLLLILAGCSSAGTVPNADDAKLQAAMARIITATGSISGVRNNPDGSPDIAVTDGILIVATNEPRSAASICKLAAALTTERTVPAGIDHVIVITVGGEKVAECSA